MSVPNYSSHVKTLYLTGMFDLTTEHGQGAFTDACVSMLNGLDANFGHLIKKPGQTDLHDHGEDSALYKLPDGKAQAVDFIGGAGGPNPQPGWIVDPQPLYTHDDWHDPQDHGVFEDAPPVPPPPVTPVYPSYEALGGDDGGKRITRQLEADFKRAGRPGLDGDCGAWQQRVSYDFLTGVCQTVDESIAKHRGEWCAALGIPVL